jgi:bacterioferritin (cytochrome b1)
MKITEKRKTVYGVTLCEDPVREPCFTVAQRDADMAEWPDAMSEISRREKLHRHMNNETGAMEIAAQLLVDFPDTPWELKMELARQCADESRHALSLLRRLKQLGGFKGEFPIANFEWCITHLCDSLEARLAIQNRTFEAGQMDLLGTLRNIWRAVNDERTAEILEHILADEVNHVRFANRWIRRLAQENPRVLFKVAVAMRMFSEVNAALAIKEGDKNVVGVDLGFKKHNNIGINVDDRRQADFSDEEINEILRQSGMSSIAAARKSA